MDKKKTIWIYWDQGWQTAPYVVKECLRSWKYHNKDYKIIKLSSNNLKEYLPGFQCNKFLPNKKMSSKLKLGGKEKMIPNYLQAKSDIIRIILLNKHGGIWVDSSLFCHRPMSQWCKDEAFVFQDPGHDRRVSSWFLKNTNNSIIFREWLKVTKQYWNNRNQSDNYYWFHLLFNKMYKQNEEVRKALHAMRYTSAVHPHRFTPYDKTFRMNATPRDINYIKTTDTPVFKLSHKYKTPNKNSPVWHLLNTINT
jgi:hypothetical protein